jgi:hypothetical protein
MEHSENNNIKNTTQGQGREKQKLVPRKMCECGAFIADILPAWKQHQNGAIHKKWEIQKTQARDTIDVNSSEKMNDKEKNQDINPILTATATSIENLRKPRKPRVRKKKLKENPTASCECGYLIPIKFG